jgi:hypothetical protein
MGVSRLSIGVPGNRERYPDNVPWPTMMVLSHHTTFRPTSSHSPPHDPSSYNYPAGPGN